VGEEGGWAVPPQFSAALLDQAAEQSIMLSRARVIPAVSNQITLPVWDTATQTSGARAGLTAGLGGSGDSFSAWGPARR
jgi:HK97 family phage major capsid protein